MLKIQHIFLFLIFRFRQVLLDFQFYYRPVILSVPGLGEVLTLSACLLFLVRWPSAMAAPTPRRRPIPPGKPKMWVNPCGVGQPQDHDGTDYHQLEVLTDKQMLQNVILEAHNALLSVEGFKHQYVSTI